MNYVLLLLLLVYFVIGLLISITLQIAYYKEAIQQVIKSKHFLDLNSLIQIILMRNIKSVSKSLDSEIVLSFLWLIPIIWMGTITEISTCFKEFFNFEFKLEDVILYVDKKSIVMDELEK